MLKHILLTAAVALGVMIAVKKIEFLDDLVNG